MAQNTPLPPTESAEEPPSQTESVNAMYMDKSTSVALELSVSSFSSFTLSADLVDRFTSSSLAIVTYLKLCSPMMESFLQAKANDVAIT